MAGRSPPHQGWRRRLPGIVGPLLLPTWAVIGIFLLLPVLLMAVYSFLTKEFRGGVDLGLHPCRL